MSSTTAIGLALASAASFGLASALQHEQARKEAIRGAMDPGLLLALARRPRWLMGIAVDVIGVVLQALALTQGAVALVQPLLVAALPVAVALSALLERRWLHMREKVGLILCTGGLALLASSTATTPSSFVPTRAAAVVAGLAVAFVTAALLVLARSSPRLAPAATGTAAGIVIGAGSVLLAVAVGRAHDAAALFGSIAPYAAVVVGLLGLLLAQSAFQTGELGAPLAALSVVEPVVAVVLAVTVLHERLPHSALTVTTSLTGSFLAVAGVIALCLRGAEPPSGVVAHQAT